MKFLWHKTIEKWTKLIYELSKGENIMKHIKALSFTLEEFKEVCDKVLEEKAWIENDHNGWFWANAEEIDEKEINNLLEKEFGKDISGFRIDKIFVDITEYTVIVSYK